MNEAFKLLFDQVKSGVVWVQRNGVVRYANKAAVQMTPVMLGQPMMDPVKRPGFRGGSNTGEWSHEEVPEVFARGA